MSNRLRIVLTAALLAGIPALAAASHSFTLIDGASSAAGVSADGSIVAGSGVGGAYYWTVDGGRVDVGGTSAVGISGDGSTITGNMTDAGLTVAGLWTSNGGWQSLGGIPGGEPSGTSLSSAYAVNYDGTVAVGLAWEDAGTALAFKWTLETGMLPLPNFGERSARANGVSDNGNWVGGWDTISWGGRRACLWNSDGTAEHILDGVVDDGFGEIYWVSDDGSFAVGSTYDGYGGFRWTRDGGAELFDLLPGTPEFGGGWATAATEDGSVIVGGQDNGDFWSPEWNAWIVTDAGGKVALVDLLADQGITLPSGYRMASASGVSADGRTIVGWGYWNGVVFDSQAFVVTLAGDGIPGDLDGDGDVDLGDLAILLAAYDTCEGDPLFNPAADIDESGCVGLADLATLLANYGTGN